MNSVAILGGGGGASVMAEGFVRHRPETEVSVIVSMSDSGGSTGKLKERYGTMPVGDLRKNTAAVAALPEIGEALNYRFGDDDTTLGDISYTFVRGIERANLDPSQAEAAIYAAHLIGQDVEDGLKGHTYGNLMLTGLAKRAGIVFASREVGTAVGARARIIPVTAESHTLVMRDGKQEIWGEYAIDTYAPSSSRCVSMRLEPPASITPEAHEAIANARLAIIGPGSPNTSIAPVLSAEGMSEALEHQKQLGGKLIAIINLVTQHHDTAGWRVHDYVKAIHRHAGRRKLDGVVYNNALDHLPDNSVAVPYGWRGRSLQLGVVAANLVGQAEAPHPNDSVLRSGVNHDSARVVRVVSEHFL